MTTALYRQILGGFFQAVTSDGNGRRGRAEGEARKQERHRLLRERRAIYVRRGQRALLARLLAVETATADDVYESVELPLFAANAKRPTGATAGRDTKSFPAKERTQFHG